MKRLGLTSFNSQITIRENDVVERPVFKPKRMIDFLFSPDTVQIIKEGKIPFEEITLTKIYGNHQYKNRKANWKN